MTLHVMMDRMIHSQSFLAYLWSCLLLVGCATIVAREKTDAQESSDVPQAAVVQVANPEPGRSAVSSGSNESAPTQASRHVSSFAGVDSVLSRGKELFAKQCAICHGENGDGAGKFAYLMNPRPRNLRQGTLKLATTQNQVPADEDLIRTISRGMPPPCCNGVWALAAGSPTSACWRRWKRADWATR